MLPTIEKQFEIEENTAPVRRLIDGEEVLYKMREIMPEPKSAEWYESACPKEISESSGLTCFLWKLTRI